VPCSGDSRVAYNPEDRIYFKEYIGRSPAKSLTAQFRGSRADRAEKAAEVLHYYGIDTPETVYRGKLSNGHDYIFTKEALGHSLLKWLRDLETSKKDSDTLRRELLRSAGKFIGRFHATGFVHGNLDPGKIIARQVNATFQFTMIAHEDTKRLEPPPGRKILANLIEVGAVPDQTLRGADRLRFFLAWRKQMRHLSPAESKIIAREALAIAK
jgi:Lipopolysaccharide kinase (Kdo/WaaP) family